jgi:hypothetical protein
MAADPTTAADVLRWAQLDLIAAVCGAVGAVVNTVLVWWHFRLTRQEIRQLKRAADQERQAGDTPAE